MNTRSSKLSLAAILDTSIGRLHVLATVIMTVHLQPPMEFAVRHTGADLYAMSTGAAGYLVESVGGSSPTVVLVSDTSWQQIAAAASLAGRLDAPVLVVPADGLRLEALSLLESAQVERAMIIGDRGGTLQAALPELDAMGIDVELIAAEDVYATASAVADIAAADRGSAGLHRTAIVIGGADPADAAVAVSLAAANDVPLLITPAEDLHPSTAAFIADNELDRVLLVGSTSEFSSAVSAAIEAAGARIVRLRGETAHELALAVGDHFEEIRGDEPQCTSGPTRFAFASPDDPLKALVAAPLLAQLCAPLSYADTDRLPPQIRNGIYLARHSQRGAQVHVFADAEQIPDSTLDIVLPPIRLAFPVTDPTQPGNNNTMAVVDEQRRVTLYLQGEGFSNIDWLAWSPSAPRLAFAASRDGVNGLFLLEYTHASRRLTPADQTLWLSTWVPAAWSPTGSHIAMSAYDDPDGEYHDRDADLYAIGVDSGEFTVLAASEEHDQFMQWNPEGSRFLFLRHDQFGLPLGWMPDRDHAFLADIGDSTVTALDLDGQALWHAQWSPNSSLIAMALVDDDVSHGGGLSTPRIQLVAIDRMPLVSADDHLTDGYVLGWSADGTLLAISEVLSDGVNFQSRFATVDVASRQLADLIADPHIDSSGEHLRFWSWSPHDNAVLFDRYNSETHDTESLLLIDINQQSHVQLPDPVAQAEYRPFGFSADGTEIGSVVYADVWLIVATDARDDGSERLLLDVTEYRGLRTEQWADVRFRWDEHGLSGTIEWYADF